MGVWMNTFVSPTPLLKRPVISNGNPKVILDGCHMLQGRPIISGLHTVGPMLAPSVTTLCRFYDVVNSNYPVSLPSPKNPGQPNAERM